jgi:PIN domain nuclease of toxin-antitoxin system
MDSSSLIALLRGEPGGRAVAEIISDTGNDCSIHALNLCEVFYHLWRSEGEKAARETVSMLVAAGIEIRLDMDSECWQAAGRLKAELRRVSLADCFCLALAIRLDAEVVTADHHEFDKVVQQGLHPIRFIR